MIRAKLLFTKICLAAFSISGAAQDGALDPTFNVGDAGFSRGDGTGGVNVVVPLSDGKVLIGGSGTFYNGEPFGRIGRVNVDGLLDAGFITGTGADNIIRTMALRPDGKILIAGDFTSYNGVARNRIARLNADGSLDLAFNPGSGADAPILKLVLQPDGGVVIAGEFTNFNATPRGRIARLLVNGALDTSFDPGSGANNIIRSIALQADGKVVMGGEFATYNGTGRSRIARCNTDGSLDSSFDPGTGLAYAGIYTPNVQSISIQTDGKILFAGQFTGYNGTTRMRIARVDANGGLDASFDPGLGTNRTLYSTAVQADGKILIGGDFITYNGTPRKMVTRLNANGTLDAGFGNATGADDYVLSIAVRTNGEIFIGGYFRSYNSTGPSGIAKLNADGSLNGTFNPGNAANGLIYTSAIQPNGKILIGGLFTSYQGYSRNRISRLNANGTLDTSFDPGTGIPTNWVNDIVVQPDGKIILAGNFDMYNGIACNNIIRINTDGSLDP
ncbi:MAG TPA: delta-60 repeat domain-containing protein, partial [Flavobacteriales bacterium]|nr:delta-60 repeat domain-containing protein [Flavobacteriales bacterium]